MSSTLPRSLLRIKYAEAAEAYLKSLPLEHFMEATSQATQREITLGSLALIRPHRQDFHLFNELLVQYPLADSPRPVQVVPDNMVILWEGEIRAEGSYDVPFQPVGPFWVMEYVSKGSRRKDYEESFRKYEQDLKVPYYLIFYPEIQELTLYRHNGSRYVAVPPNEQGRCPIPELDMEVGLLDGWARFWYKGRLLPLPADLQRALEEANRRAAEEKQRREQAERVAEEQKRGREEAEQRAQEAARRADEQARRAEEERQARLALEQRLAQLQAQLEQRPPEPKPNE